MSRLNLNTFLSGHNSFFDLNGVSCSDKDVPFRIRIGSRRVLNVRANPALLSIDFWGVKDGQATYLHNHPVPVEYDKDGVLTFDACAFMDAYGSCCLCTTETYRKRKERPIQSDTIMTTPYGAARSCYGGADFPAPYTDIFFAPGALTICGQPVRAISWEALDMRHPKKGSYLRPVIEGLLSEPHDLAKKDVMRLLRKMDPFRFNCVWFLTDTGSYAFKTFSDEPNDIRLDREYFHYYPTSIDPLDVIDLGLTLLKARTPAELEKSLARQYRKDLAYPETFEECEDAEE